MKDHTIRT